MGQEPAQVRQDIEQTREQMGETVEAIAYKADVPARTKERVQDTMRRGKSKVSGRTPDGQQAKQKAKQAVGVAQENPIGLAVGSIAVGVLAGMLIPSTSVEDERLGPVADEVKEQARQTGQEALDRGKQVAQEAASTAQEHAQQAAQDVKTTTQEHGQQHAEEFKASAQEKAEQTAQQAKPQT